MADSVFKELATASDETIDGLTPPSTKVVDFMHGNASTNEPSDIHHRIGFGPNDAAAGDHTHNGENSSYLFTGLTLVDISPTATGTQIANAVNALNAALRQLGAQ